MDTGAQEAIVGETYLNRMSEKLYAEGLPYEWHCADDIGEVPRGTGGSATLVGRISAPPGLAGANGVLRFKVVWEGASPLIPVALAKAVRYSWSCLRRATRASGLLMTATVERASSHLARRYGC